VAGGFLADHLPFSILITYTTYAVARVVAIYCLRQSGTLSSLVFGFSARRAQKPNTQIKESTMLPQAEYLNIPSPSAEGTLGP
jgi:hypothetical protein